MFPHGHRQGRRSPSPRVQGLDSGEFRVKKKVDREPPRPLLVRLLFEMGENHLHAPVYTVFLPKLFSYRGRSLLDEWI